MHTSSFATALTYTAITPRFILTSGNSTTTNYPQHQSPLFSRLPQEIRDKIYTFTLTLSHHVHPGVSHRIFPAGCLSCQLHLINCPISCDKLDQPIVQHRVSLLRSCRRLYDEARSTLYKENTFIFGSSFCHDLVLDIEMFVAGLSLHRGNPHLSIIIGTMVLVIGDERSPYEASTNINALSWALRSARSLMVYNMQLLFLRFNFHFAEDARSFYLALDALQPVQTCNILGLHPKPQSLEFWYEYYDLTKPLIKAALSTPAARESKVTCSGKLSKSGSDVFAPCPL